MQVFRDTPITKSRVWAQEQLNHGLRRLATNLIHPPSLPPLQSRPLASSGRESTAPARTGDTQPPACGPLGIQPRQEPARAGVIRLRTRPSRQSPATSSYAAKSMRIFSGIQPTGRKHLGNYIGAITQYVAGQDRGEAIYCIVDLHAITVAYEPEALREAVYDTAAILLAAGLDPDRCIFFRQSDVREHTELCWLLSSVTSFGELNRMTQFKEKSGSQRDLVSGGLFFYPVLQAADVLAYRAHDVPVGEDQRQHVELMRDVARAVQRSLRRDAGGARGAAAGGRGADHGSPVPRPQDVDDRWQPAGNRARAR